MITDRLPLMENTPLFAAFAVLALALVAWRVRSGRFRQISWRYFSLAAALFWGSLATILVLSVWERYYSHFAPPYYRIAAPLASLVVYPLWVLLLRWLALRLPGLPAVSFCLLGGLQALFEHAIGIYRLNLLDVPMLQGSSPLAIFLFAFFEYIVYWAIVLLLADTIKRLVERLKPITANLLLWIHP